MTRLPAKLLPSSRASGKMVAFDRIYGFTGATDGNEFGQSSLDAKELFDGFTAPCAGDCPQQLSMYARGYQGETPSI